jgi:hypothetical protein
VEIEPHTFDDLISLSDLVLIGNGLKSLPDGLFSKNANLEVVAIIQAMNYTIENVSPENFTHWKNFKDFILEAPVLVPAQEMNQSLQITKAGTVVRLHTPLVFSRISGSAMVLIYLLSGSN